MTGRHDRVACLDPGPHATLRRPAQARGRNPVGASIDLPAAGPAEALPEHQPQHPRRLGREHAACRLRAATALPRVVMLPKQAETNSACSPASLSARCNSIHAFRTCYKSTRRRRRLLQPATKLPGSVREALHALVGLLEPSRCYAMSLANLKSWLPSRVSSFSPTKYMTSGRIPRCL